MRENGLLKKRNRTGHKRATKQGQEKETVTYKIAVATSEKINV